MIQLLYLIYSIILLTVFALVCYLTDMNNKLPLCLFKSYIGTVSVVLLNTEGGTLVIFRVLVGCDVLLLELVSTSYLCLDKEFYTIRYYTVTNKYYLFTEDKYFELYDCTK